MTKKHHSTKSALLKVTNDLLLITDSGNYAIPILVYLYTLFDTGLEDPY